MTHTTIAPRCSSNACGFDLVTVPIASDLGVAVAAAIHGLDPNAHVEVSSDYALAYFTGTNAEAQAATMGAKILAAAEQLKPLQALSNGTLCYATPQLARKKTQKCKMVNKMCVLGRRPLVPKPFSGGTKGKTGK